VCPKEGRSHNQSEAKNRLMRRRRVDIAQEREHRGKQR
jgi:hypothetical protein